MAAVCEVFRRSGSTNTLRYNPETGDVFGVQMCLLYRGPVRAIANKDWRARRKNLRGDSGVQHGYRMQLPIRECPPIHAYDVIRVIDCPPDQELTHYVFHVRNLTPSTHSWLRNILCDADMAHPSLLPPPSVAPVVMTGHLLADGAACGCGAEPTTMEAN
jgi:hypothetical protein